MNEKLATTTIDILKIPIGSLSKFETKQLYEYLVEANKQLEEAKRLKQWLHSAIALKYEPFVSAKRRRMEKDSGVIDLEEPNFKVTNDIPRKIEWRQDILGKIVCQFLLQGGNLSDYVEVYYHIPEEKYESLPEEIKHKVKPARIIKLGNPVYKITKLNIKASNSNFEIATLNELGGYYE